MAGEGKQYYDGDRAVAWKIPGDVDLIRFLDGMLLIRHGEG